ncbi:hypothetical protein GYMLUDRAFT_177907 [Collybiopsis luxurians FD-317 M1]|uniref:Uncharacterized protein n=1 Tax=Collybiopsis luxurians FD-317 M1 TaxID=944289 RepID=A0A0D0BH59_9AGAR|nr:hypothetical protein GYMLUDRAFT_177907 [Collybiopsis luxurians FD-317 M1]
MIIPSVTDLQAFVARSNTAIERSSFSSSTSDSCNNINDCRTLLQIVWSCISVLIACTWVSVHPNVPGPDESSWKLLRRKIGLMIIALIAPEMLVLWAAKQWFAARMLSKWYQGWTRTHAFFAIMGGFALYEGKKAPSVLRDFPSRLDITTSSYNAASEAEIKDRSHNDGFSKLIAIMQTGWFVVQLFARWVEGLPVTELEVMTLAFAAMNVLIYFFWWDKPQGVGCQIRIVRKTMADEDNIDQPGASAKQKEGWIATAWSWLRNILGNALEMVRGFFNQSSKVMLRNVLSIPSIFKTFMLDFVQMIADVILEDRHNDVDKAEMVLSFERTVELERANAQDKFIAYGAAVMFGIIHCVAWTSKFPTSTEEVLWKVSSLIVTCAPMYLAFHNIIVKTEVSENLPSWLGACLIWAYVGTVSFYILARLSLIVQPFMALRHLPHGVIETVQWTNFIPHI